MLLLIPACGGGGPTAALTVAPSAALQALATTPWPSDLFLDDAGHVALAQLPTSMVDASAGVLADLNQIEDGFGVLSGAFFPLSEAIDPATLDGNVHLYDLESGDELPILSHLRANDQPPVLYARPANGVVLLEKHQYAYVVTNRVHGKSGALRASGDLAGVLGHKSPPSGSLARAYAVYKPLLDLLDKGKPTRADVAAATVFTTHSITAPLVSMRAALDTSGAPKAAVTMIFAKIKSGTNAGSLDDLLGTPAQNLPGTDNVGGIAHDHLGFVVQGSFQTPDYLNNRTDLTAAGGTPTSVDVFDGGNHPTPRGTATVPFTLVLPDLPAAQYANLPVVIFQHGINGDRSSLMAVSNDLAAKGMATLGIDIAFHGARQPAVADKLHTFGGGTGPDGWADSDGIPFLAFLDVTGNQSKGIASFLPLALRSAFMQSALDMMQEARLVVVGDLSAVAAQEPRLSQLSLRHDALGYSGESFGSMIGGIAVAIEPTIGAAFLDVGGGGLLFPLLLSSKEFGPQIAPVLDGALGTNTADPTDPADTDFAYNLSAYLVEQADASAYAPYVVLHPVGGNAPKHVVQPSAHFDETVPNQANESLARGLGLAPVNLPAGGSVDLQFWTQPPVPASPPVAGNLMVGGKPITAVFIQFEEASHGMITKQNGKHSADLTKPYPYPRITEVPIANPIVRLHSIYTSFFSDYFAGKVPTVTSGL